MTTPFSTLEQWLLAALLTLCGIAVLFAAKKAQNAILYHFELREVRKLSHTMRVSTTVPVAQKGKDQK